jgi:hypothetical protein
MVGSGLEATFPGLQGKAYQFTSPRDQRYNCVAFAAGDMGAWWWPDPDGADFWSSGVARDETIDAFRDAFNTLGYVVCSDEQLEPNVEKLAIFALATVPKHAARQLKNGNWTSKLGPSEDIEHSLRDLEGTVYGSVVLIMKRPRSTSAA